MNGQEKTIRDVISLLAKRLKVDVNSLCLCGNGKKFKNCCGSATKSDLIYITLPIDKAKAYRKSQKTNIQSIPMGIWKSFEAASFARLPCLYPQCKKSPVECHLIPENILSQAFGGHCKEYKPQDGAQILQFAKSGVREASCSRVFCNEHDNSIFHQIDKFEFDTTSKEINFLFALKAAAFSLRRNQFLLGIDSQVAILQPFLLSEAQSIPAGHQVTINIDHLHAQYIRFVLAHSFWKQTFEAYESKKWDSLNYFYRSIEVTQPLFAGGLINPSHDLEGNKINTSGNAIALAGSIFTKGNRLHVLFSPIGDGGHILYRKFFDQLDATHENVFITAINNLLTACPVNSIILPESFASNSVDLNRMILSRDLMTATLNSSHTIYDLKNSELSLEFIKNSRKI